LVETPALAAAPEADPEDKLLVLRRDSPYVPPPTDPCINWEDTVCLNAVLHRFVYKLAVAIGERPAPGAPLNLLNKVTKRVYASPSKRRMDSKEGQTQVTYPMIYFAIDDFEHIYADLLVRPGQMLCVQLVASDPKTDRRSTVFQGSVPYDALLELFHWKSGWASLVPELSQKQFLKLKGSRLRRVRHRCGVVHVD